MKKIVLLLLVSSTSFAQLSSRLKHTIGIGITTTKSFEFNYIYENNEYSNYVDKIGLGIIKPFDRYEFPDVYKYKPTFGMYGILGKQLKEFNVNGKIGVGYYDKPDGNEWATCLVGGFIGYDYAECINFNAGYDTVNYFTFGIGIKF